MYLPVFFMYVNGTQTLFHKRENEYIYRIKFIWLLNRIIFIVFQYFVEVFITLENFYNKSWRISYVIELFYESAAR